MVRHAVRHPGAMALAACALTACGSKHEVVGPNQVSATVSLSPDSFALYSGTAATGRIHFPATGQDAQYLVVGQFATGNPDVKATASVTVEGALAADVVAAPARNVTPDPGPALRFHDLLRAREGEFARAARLLPRALSVTHVDSLPTHRTFKVCANIQCTPPLANVPATRKSLGAHAVIYVDDSVPGGGFTQTDFDNLTAQFDSVLYPLDRAAFGAESDIDANGVVIILLTRKINALVPPPDCNTSYVTGFFYGADIAPGIAGSFNNGEVFYGMVPDPGGDVSCARSTAFVRKTIPVTFIHEFQHMISFNQHVLVHGGNTEVLWLNEGLSHLAEELGGLHYDSLGLATKEDFYSGDFYNGYIYLRSPSLNAMVSDSPPGSLESRGGEWLFLRYVMDQFGATTTHALENTASTGAGNVQQATGVPFSQLLGRWALAMWASDLGTVQPGFTAPPKLRYVARPLRATYQALHDTSGTYSVAFPLVPHAAPSSGITVTAQTMSGSGTYVLVSQPAGSPAFDVTFLTPSAGQLPGSAGAQVAVLRTK